MKLRLLVTLGLLAPAIAFGASPFTSLHPEEAHPDPDTRVQSGPHSGLVSQVQEKLRALGFDAGPVNGDFGEKTQAALAQFQLSVPVPASGQLDDQTLLALGLQRDGDPAAGGASAASAITVPVQPAPGGKPSP